MNTTDYQFLAKFLRDSSGLTIGENKLYLLESRLNPIAKRRGLPDLAALVSEVRSGRDKQLIDEVVESMTTNETSFFRDQTPFDELRNALLPELICNRQSTRKLRIWCAAGSTGQEPYSIGILIREYFPQLSTWNIEIVATDLATEPIRRAKAAVYSQFEVQRGLPIQLLVKYFTQVDGGWKLKSDIVDMVRWQQLNLLRPFSHLGKFDLVFCRNVLIYFDVETKRDILERISRQFAEDGYLILGAAEMVIGVSNDFQRCSNYRSSVYRLDAPVKV